MSRVLVLVLVLVLDGCGSSRTPRESATSQGVPLGDASATVAPGQSAWDASYRCETRDRFVHLDVHVAEVSASGRLRFGTPDHDPLASGGEYELLGSVERSGDRYAIALSPSRWIHRAGRGDMAGVLVFGGGSERPVAIFKDPGCSNAEIRLRRSGPGVWRPL